MNDSMLIDVFLPKMVNDCFCVCMRIRVRLVIYTKPKADTGLVLGTGIND